VKWINDSLRGGKKYTKSGTAGEYRGCTSSFEAKRIVGGNARVDKSIGATSIHPIEMACYFYMMSQAVKHGFRFVLWPYLGFNAGYFLLGLLVLVVIILRWFAVAERCTIDFGTFSISFELVPAQKPDDRTRTRTRTRTQTSPKQYVREKAMGLATTFVILKSNKKLAWTWILFLLFLLVPILYYCLAYPPFIF
jgi:hypothetical protein